MATKTEKNVQLKINKMTKNIFDQLSVQGLISEDELYLLPEDEEKSIQEQVNGIEAKIPSAATSENQLADKAFVNSSINNYAAFYLTKNVNGDAFGGYAELTSATKFYYAGVEKTPTKNDYLVVLEDETKTTALGINPTTRYTYQGEWPTGQFEFQYVVNNTSLTQEQIDAINSGITKSIVDSRVIPSDEFPGYAIYAVNANYATQSDTANTANYAQMADTANTATTANTADTANTATTAEAALSANTALSANYAQNAEFANDSMYTQIADFATVAKTAKSANKATTANTAISATYAPDYTPLSTFNQTLGNLSSIIHEI